MRKYQFKNIVLTEIVLTYKCKNRETIDKNVGAHD